MPSMRCGMALTALDFFVGCIVGRVVLWNCSILHFELKHGRTRRRGAGATLTAAPLACAAAAATAAAISLPAGTTLPPKPTTQPLYQPAVQGYLSLGLCKHDELGHCSPTAWRVGCTAPPAPAPPSPPLVAANQLKLPLAVCMLLLWLWVQVCATMGSVPYRNKRKLEQETPGKLGRRRGVGGTAGANSARQVSGTAALKHSPPSAHSAAVHPTAGSPLEVCMQLKRGRPAKPIQQLVVQQYSVRNEQPCPASGVGSKQQAWFRLLCPAGCETLMQIKTACQRVDEVVEEAFWCVKCRQGSSSGSRKRRQLSALQRAGADMLQQMSEAGRFSVEHRACPHCHRSLLMQC